MKTVLMALVLMLIAGCAHFDPWTKEQIVIQGVVTGLNVIDWGQTLDIAGKPDKYCEINPIIGEHPSKGRVNCYFATSIIVKILITYVIPSKYRKYWLGCNIAMSGYLVHKNYRIGLRINY